MKSFADIVAAPPPPTLDTALADGVVDVNVDIKCAVKLTAFEHGAKSLPLLNLPYIQDRMRDRIGRLRSPSTMPENCRGKRPASYGKSYRASPLSDDEMFVLLAMYGESPTDVRDSALIGLLWRSGLRISEAMALTLDDLNREAGKITVRHGKNDKYGTVGMDAFGWELLEPWLNIRGRYPVGDGLIFCVVWGKSAGLGMHSSAFRVKMHKLARQAGITKRVHPHGLRHTLAVGLDREGLRLPLIQRQLRHSNPGITGRYLEGISNSEVIEAVGARVRPMREGDDA